METKYKKLQKTITVPGTYFTQLYVMPLNRKALMETLP